MILGLVVLVCGGLYEVHTNRDALFPATSFIDLTIGWCAVVFARNIDDIICDRDCSYYYLSPQFRIQLGNILFGAVFSGMYLLRILCAPY